MALKGSVTIDATPNSCDLLVFAWEATQDAEARTSKIAWTMKLVADDTYGLITGVTEGTRTWSVTIDGQTFTGQNGVNVQPGETRLLAQGTIDLVHNDDGTRSFDFTFSQEIGITWGASSGNPQEIGTVSGSGSGELDAFVVDPEEPEPEEFDLQSFLTGLAMALCSRGRIPTPQREPVAFLYNGVRLPKFPELQYQYAVIGKGINLKTYLRTSQSVSYKSGTSVLIPRPTKDWVLTDGEWIYDGETIPVEGEGGSTVAFAQSRVIWANHPIVDTDTNETFLEESTPVPVYE